MSTSLDLFVEEAKGVTVVEAGLALGFWKDQPRNYAGPCPSCAGTDRFSIDIRKPAFNCRQCGARGRDGIALYALANGHNLRSRTGFLAACSEALGGREIPDGGERETEAERAEREQRIAAQKQRNAEAAVQSDSDQNVFREREIAKARGIYLNALEVPQPLLREYLRLRTSFDMHEAVFANLRLIPNCTYWHGKDMRGHAIAHSSGPAMVAPFVRLDAKLKGTITGCHQTWIDLRQKPKYRPLLTDDDGTILPAKKMRGTKIGSFIPLFGLVSSARWVGGEGIENGLTIAGSEGFRADTFYFAAGDLGNLAGPRDAKSDFAHPHDTFADKAGRIRAVRVMGPVPKPDQDEGDAMQVPDHVTELLLLADGDSEFVATSAAMARAVTRLERKGRDVWTWWPKAGRDFSGMMSGNEA